MIEKKKIFIASLILAAFLIIYCSLVEAIPPTAPQSASSGVVDYTVATLPSPATGDVVAVSDGSTTSDCTVGGGSNYVLCVYNGAAWVAFGDGTTSGVGSGSMTTVESGDSEVYNAVVYLDFNASAFDITHSPTTEINISVDLTPSSGNATLVLEEDAIQVKYDTTDFTEGTTGLLLSATPTIATALLMGTDPADAGTIRMPNAGSIVFEDATEGAITHVDNYGFSFNVDLEAADGNNAFIIRADNEATDTLELQAMDIDGSYTSLVTLTSHATAPTLALTSVGNSTYASTGGTVTIESVVFTGGALSSVSSITDGTASWSSSSLSGFADITSTDDITVGDDLLLSSTGSIINFFSGDVLLTHSAEKLAFTGGTYTFDSGVTVTGNVDATTFTGALTGAVTGNASSATLAATSTIVDSTDASSYVVIVDSASGSLALKTDSGVSYNASTGMLYASGFTGPLTGNVTGNVTGALTGNADTATTAGTVTTAAQPAITSVGTLTGLTVSGAIVPYEANSIAVGSATSEFADLFLGDGAIIKGQNDQSATLTSSASLWTANNFAVDTQFRLPSSDAGPTATAGYIRHDSTVSGVSDGAVVWHDGANPRYVVDLHTLPSDDDYVVAYDADSNLFYMKVDQSAGAPSFDTVGDPEAAVTLSHGDNETITITTAQNTAGSFFIIDNTVADVGNNVYLIEGQYTDDDDANAFFLKFSDNNGAEVEFSVGPQGVVSIGEDPADSGTIRLPNAAIIAWEDATEATITHVNDVGLAFNLGIDVQGATGITLSNDETITNATNGTVTLSGNLEVQGNDPYIFINETDHTDWYVGIDDAGDSLEFRTNATVGNTVLVEVEEDGDIVITGDITATGTDLLLGAAATGVKFAGSAEGVLTVQGLGSGTADESLAIDFDTTANLVSISSASGVTEIDFTTIQVSAGAFDASDGNITNVGDIAVDSISADGTNISIVAASGTVTVESVVFTAGALTGITAMDGVTIGDGGGTNYIAVSDAGAVTFAGSASITLPVGTAIGAVAFTDLDGVYSNFSASGTTTINNIFAAIDTAWSSMGGDVTSVGGTDATGCTDGDCLDGSSNGGQVIALYDGDSHKLTIDAADLTGDATIVLGSNTNNLTITNGTATIDIAAGATLNLDSGVSFTTSPGTIAFSANKTLTIEDTSLVNQDLTTDASPTFTAVTAPTHSGVTTISGTVILTIGAGTEKVVINSSDWDIDATGAISNASFDVDNSNSLSNVVNANIKDGAAIDATKIANGSVTSTEFQYIASLTSDVQTHIENILSGVTPFTKATIAEIEYTGTTLTIDVIKTDGASTLAVTNSDGTYAANLSVDGDLTITGGDITLGTTSIFSGGDTASLNNIDAIDATTEATIEAAIDTLSGLTTIGGASSNSIYITAAASDQDIIFTVDDGGTDKTVTIDGSESTVDFGADNLAMSIKIHDAGIITMYDDGDDTSVVIGPVADGTTTLGVTGSITASATITAEQITSTDDIYLDSDSAVLAFGADQDVTLTHVADTGIRLADNIKFIWGTNNDWGVLYDETTSDALEFSTAGVASGATTTPMFLIQVDSGSAGTITANQLVFAIATGVTNVLTVDEDGDVTITGGLYTQAADNPSIILDDDTTGDLDIWIGNETDDDGTTAGDYLTIGTGTTVGSGTDLLRIDVSGNAVFAATIKGTSFVLEGGTYDITIDADAPTASTTYSWPNGPPAASGYALVSTTGGTMSWAEITATAGGADTNVQYNSSGTLGGEAALAYNATNNTLSITQAASNVSFQVGDGTYSWFNTPQVGIEGAVEHQGNVFLDDGSGDSPNITFKDATDTTMILAKVDNSWFTMTPSSASYGVNIVDGNLKVGNGTPTVTLGGEDAYVEGTFEVDSTSRFDGYVKFTTGVSGALLPYDSDGGAIGSGTSMWSDLFLASGGVVSFNNGDVTVTHSAANTLAFAGASVGYTFDSGVTTTGHINPGTADTYDLGHASGEWANLYLGDSSVVYFQNDQSVYLTSAAGKLTLTGSLVTTSGVTVGTTLFPDENDGAALGTTDVSWSDLFLASGAVINFNAGDVTLTHSANTLTLGGGALALGSNNLTMTGSISDTTNRVLKGWFSDIESTSMPTVGGTSLSDTFVAKATYDANTILVANTDNTPAAIAVATGTTTFLTTPSSANLATAVTDETGSGSLVFSTSPAISTSILPKLATATIGSGTSEWASLYLGDGGVIYGQADSSATLTSAASLWTANNFAVDTQFKLPSTNADPTATAGYLRHDSTVTNYNGGALRYHDGTRIMQVIGMSGVTAEACTDTQVIAYNATTDDWYCKADADSGGTPTVITVAAGGDADSFVALFEAASGDLGPKTDTGLTWNATTDSLTIAGNLVVTGQASGGAKTYSVASGVTNSTQLSDVTGPSTLIAAEVSGTIINVDSSGVTRFTLPTPASGYNTIFNIGISGVTVQVESGTTMYVGGTATTTGGVGAQIINVSIGEHINCWTGNVPVTGGPSGEIEWFCRKTDD